MTIFFGLDLDEGAYLENETTNFGTMVVGPKQLLFLLEGQLGLAGHANDVEYLRVEQYRQAIIQYLSLNEECFFSNSFEADQFATANEMLRRRDELAEAGYKFEEENSAPERIRIIAEIESLLTLEPSLTLSSGFADRINDVILALENQETSIEKIFLNEPPDLQKVALKRLFDALSEKSEIIELNDDSKIETSQKTDLGSLKNIILNGNKGNETNALKNDGSLLILQSKRANESASWISKFLLKNPEFKPLCLIPEKNRGLDNAFIQEGIPSLGIPSASLARPSLQILKLVPAFLWEPIDPYKLLEFVSLAVKPLDDGLGFVIGRLMASKPGMNSDEWKRGIEGYFGQLLNDESNDAVNYDYIRKEYEFWFERKRHNVNSTVPKREVIEIFEKLEQWAFEVFDEEGSKNSSLIVLSEQSRRIKELLQTLPETQLTFLELERIVRTIYEPSPVVFRQEEINRLNHIYDSSAVLSECEEFLWWNFSETESTRFFSRWYPNERKYLKTKNIALDTPAMENSRMLWQRIRPILKTQKRLVLMFAETVDGNDVHPHPLFGDLEAAFGHLDNITLDLSKNTGAKNWAKHFNLPDKIELKSQKFGTPKPFVEIKERPVLKDLGVQSPTKLQTLLYYPYQWMFKEKIQLRQSSILSVIKENTLYGNLAHHLFERLLRKDFYTWDKGMVEDYIERSIPILLSKEGAILMMYGREPDRIAFEYKVKFAAWNLVSMIQNNGWKVLKTEMELEETVNNTEYKGFADIVLERGAEKAIIDLKWRGIGWRRDLIKNEEDIQLVLYAQLLKKESTWPNTSFFIIENGKMLSRNNNAFSEVSPIVPDSDDQEVYDKIFNKMESTYHWRKEQLANGRIEIRCTQTALALEDFYHEKEVDLFSKLEMKTENAKFDEYRVLIDLVE